MIRNLTLTLVLFQFTASAQQLSLQDVLQKVENYYRSNPVEKVFIHHPKKRYAKGETLWYKAYLVDGMTNQPNQSSRIVYTELIHQETNEIYRTKSRVSKGFADGYFEISDTLRSGSYLLRAYTLYMRNFGEDYFFYDQVQITDTHAANVPMEPRFQNTDKVNFFPEGGKFVAGIPNKVGIEVLDENGVGGSVSGVVKDQQGTVVAELQTNDMGIGSVFFSPLANASYTFETGSKQFDFPSVNRNGVNLLTYQNASDQLVINVQANREFLRSNNSQHYLIIQSGNFEVLTVEPDLRRRGFVATIPRSDLPTGLLNIALISDNGAVAAERLYYVPEPTLRYKVSLSETSYQRREKAIVELNIKDATGAPVEGNFSISVSDQRQTTSGYQGVNNYLNLFSDIEGYVTNKEQYTDLQDEEVLKNLDNLLLSKKWQKLNWNNILTGNIPHQKYANEKFLWLRGKAFEKESQQPLIDKRVAVILVENELLAEYGTNDDGEFYIPFPDFTGSDIAFLSFEGWDKNTMDYTLEVPAGINNNTTGQFPIIDMKRDMDSPGLQSILTSFNFYEEKPIDADENADGDAGKYSHIDDQLINLDDYVRLSDILEILKEIVPGVSLKNPNRKDVEARIFSTELGGNFEGPPLYMLDGIPTYDTDLVFSLDPSSIASIGVIRSFEAIEKYGSIAQNGIIEINSNDGNLSNSTTATIVPYQGFVEPKDFGFPDYNELGRRSTRIPDLRHIMYWNPNATTDAQGNATLEFFTGDLIADFEVIVHGFGNDLAGTGQAILKVGATN
ncbi:MAG: hypothetical protein RJQ09_16450 [Cyclobacteriaceae bacterium]